MPAAVARIRDGLQQILERGRTDPAWVAGDDEDIHAFVERQLVALIGDDGRRLHTGRSRNEQVSLDFRLYLRRRIPLLQAACARRRRRPGRSGRPGRRGADAGLHPHAPRDAGAGQPLPAQPRRGAAPRSPAAGRGDGRGRRAAARLGRRGRHRLRHRHRGAGPRARVLARRAQQHGHLVGPRLRGQLPARGVAGDGPPQPAGRGRHLLHRRGVRVLRAGRQLGHRQQHDAAEEEPRSDGAGARQGRAASSATRWRCWWR